MTGKKISDPDFPSNGSDMVDRKERDGLQSRPEFGSIAVNCYGLKPGAGGIGVYWRDIVASLQTVRPELHISLAHGSGNIAELERLLPGGWQQHGRCMDDWRELTSFLVSQDIYFAPLNGYYPLPLRAPTVVTLHDNQERFFPELFDDGQIRQRRILQKGAAICSDLIVTVSQFAADCLSAGYGVPPQKIRVCPHFAHTLPAPQPPERPLPAEFIFYPANRWPHKNHRALIEALASLRAELGVDVNLVCSGYRLGNGVDVSRMAADCGVADLVHDIGFVTESEVAWLYANAKAMVFPSLYEGFGYPVLEAMSLGCPVVAARAGALPEVAGNAALYFSPVDREEMAAAIRSIWLDQGLRLRLEECGLERVKVFSRERFLETHILAFQDAIRLFSTRRHLQRTVRYHLIHKLMCRLREFFQGVRFERHAQLPDLPVTGGPTVPIRNE